MLRHSFCLLSLFAIAGVVGCADKPKPEVVPPLEPVTGTVKLDGQPAEGIAVTFYPIGNNKGNPSSGITGADGGYTLVYRTGAAGIPAGDYVALFSKMTAPDGSPIPAGKTSADVMAEERLPERYRDTANIQNNVNVPAGGKTFDFNLQSK